MALLSRTRRHQDKVAAGLCLDLTPEEVKGKMLGAQSGSTLAVKPPQLSAHCIMGVVVVSKARKVSKARQFFPWH